MKILGNILYADLVRINNNTTGEVREMTKILYTTEIDNSSEHVGAGILECYINGNKLQAIEPFTKVIEIQGKKVRPLYELEIEERLIKNGKKMYVSKVNNVSLK